MQIQFYFGRSSSRWKNTNLAGLEVAAAVVLTLEEEVLAAVQVTVVVGVKGSSALWMIFLSFIFISFFQLHYEMFVVLVCPIAASLLKPNLLAVQDLDQGPCLHNLALGRDKILCQGSNYLVVIFLSLIYLFGAGSFNGC